MATGWPRVALVVLEGFVALTAIAGGIALATGLERNRFPLAWLEGTPFHSYVVPGLILCLVVGGMAAAATIVVLRAPMAGAWLSLAASVTLVGQIVGELVLLRQPDKPSSTEVFYLAVAIVTAAVAAFMVAAQPGAR